MTLKSIKKKKKIKCKCGSKFIVNKKYSLCERCNYLRLHGESKEKVYEQRRNSGNKERRRLLVNEQGRNNKIASIHGNPTSVSKSLEGTNRSIKKISRTNTYLCSDGRRVTKQEINRNYVKVCREIELERPKVCEGTGRTDLPLSFSHTISRSRCQQIGKTELIWDKANIEVESMQEPCSKPEAAHNTWSDAPLEDKKKLLNFERKLEYIKKHDPELWMKYQEN